MMKKQRYKTQANVLYLEEVIDLLTAFHYFAVLSHNYSSNQEKTMSNLSYLLP